MKKVLPLISIFMSILPILDQAIKTYTGGPHDISHVFLAIGVMGCGIGHLFGAKA